MKRILVISSLGILLALGSLWFINQPSYCGSCFNLGDPCVVDAVCIGMGCKCAKSLGKGVCAPK